MREIEAKIEVESEDGDITVTVLGKFEDGELENITIWNQSADKTLPSTPADLHRAEEALYEVYRHEQENGYSGD